MELDVRIIEEELGELVIIEQLCPDVWYAAINTGKSFADEYYIAATDAQCLSDYAKKLGKTCETPDLLFYELEEVEGGKFVVKYEVQRWLKLHNVPTQKDDDLLTTAVYGTEHYPDYFGDYPAPIITPRGMTTRRCKLEKGIFAVETENCETMVAVCSPIWPGDLSDYVIKHGEQIENNDLGYMFFPHPASSLALFELKWSYEDIANSSYINWPALMNTTILNTPQRTIPVNSTD